jgi:hypothetical protein
MTLSRLLRHTVLATAGLVSTLATLPADAAIARWFGWGYSENEVYKEISEYVDIAGNALGVVGVVAPPAAAVGTIVRTVKVIADVIDPPADSFNAIVSGRFTLSFDPSMRVVAAGWYGEFGANPSLPAPTGDLALADISTLQLQANAAMQHASITVDQAAGLAVFEFDWGPAGMVPSLNVDSNGHTNIAALLLEAPAQPVFNAVTVLGSPAETAALGTQSSTYMLCTSGYCGVNPVPEPQVWALMVASLGVIGWQVRGRRSTLRPLTAVDRPCTPLAAP